MICEGTGGYERQLVAALHAAGIPVVVANPRQLRSFALGHGILEKSDPIDAAVIRRFGQDVRNLNLATPKSEDQEKHGALARRRKSLLEMINQEENRLKQTADQRRSRLCEAGAVHGHLGGDASQRGHPKFLPASAGVGRLRAS